MGIYRKICALFSNFNIKLIHETNFGKENKTKQKQKSQKCGFLLSV